jgi:hypothetical protein
LRTPRGALCPAAVLQAASATLPRKTTSRNLDLMANGLNAARRTQQVHAAIEATVQTPGFSAILPA